MAIDLSKNVIDTIPPPDEVRAQLAKTLNEADILRRMLRLSEQKAKRLRKEAPCA
jgi:hypothetical protein